MWEGPPRRGQTLQRGRGLGRWEGPWDVGGASVWGRSLNVGEGPLGCGRGLGVEVEPGPLPCLSQVSQRHVFFLFLLGQQIPSCSLGSCD